MSSKPSAAPLGVAFAALFVMGAASGARAQGISVVVNDQPVSFAGTPPREVNGAVLVPLRGVFEQLGASVNYDPATKTIQAKKGDTNVSLVLGSATAFVNGQPQVLTQPAAVIGGTTLVPLRFVAQSFGAYVQWLAQSQTVQIKTQEPHLAQLPAPPPPKAADQGQIVGNLTGVYTNTVPQQITLRVNGQNTAVPITDATIVLIQSDEQPAVQKSPKDLTVGDQVRVTRNADGTAQVIQAVYGEITGTVKSITPLADGSSVINLNDGTSVQIARGAPVTMGGRDVSLKEVMHSEKVVIRTNRDNKQGYGVAVVTADDLNPTPPSPAPTPPMPMPAPGPMPAPTGGGPVPGPMPAPSGATVGVTIQSFSTNVTGPLRGNDLFHIVLRGTPGSKATFSIPNVVERQSPA